MKYEVVDKSGKWYLKQDIPVLESQVKEIAKIYNVAKKDLKIKEVVEN